MNAIRLLTFIVAGNALLLVLQAVRVVAVYSAIYSMTTGPKRQLPLHVWLIAVSYLMFVSATGYFLILTAVNVVLQRTIIYGVAGLLGQYALWNILKYDRRRLSSASTMADLDDLDA